MTPQPLAFTATEQESAPGRSDRGDGDRHRKAHSTVDFFAYPESNMHLPAGVEARFVVIPMDGPDLLGILPSGETLAAAIDATIVNSLAIVGST